MAYPWSISRSAVIAADVEGEARALDQVEGLLALAGVDPQLGLDGGEVVGHAVGVDRGVEGLAAADRSRVAWRTV